MPRTSLWCCALTAVVGVAGCGGGSSTSYSGGAATSFPAAMADSLAATDASTMAADWNGNASAATDPRKIIYTGNVKLTTPDFGPIPGRVVELTEQHGGYVATSDVQGAAGTPRSGRWTLRVPAEKYQALLQTAVGLGELVSRTEESQEVTAEYLDLEARIRAKLEEEKRMTTHLHEDARTLEQILQIERELQRVRTEAEQMQGRLRLLADLTALSTINLQVTEVQAFVPPESPTFGTLIARTWEESTGRLLALGRAVVLTIVGLAPWALVLAIPMTLLWRPASRFVRRRSTRFTA